MRCRSKGDIKVLTNFYLLLYGLIINLKGNFVKKKEVIKHSSTIQISNKINLLERRSWNVLLSYAFDDLKEKDTYEISIKQLAEILDFNSKKLEYLKEILRKLNRTQIEWNILNKDKKQDWGVSTLLADARIINGVCFYSYSPFMRKKLHNPEMYAKINLSLQNKFKSKHSLALYELFVDYYNEKKKFGETPRLSINDIRKLLGLNSGEYEEFKFLKRDVLKKAISEINRKTNIFGETLFFKESRKVTHVKFMIKPNKENSLDIKKMKIIKKKRKTLPIDEFELDNQELFSILTVEFGISNKKAVNILKTMDEFYIQENLNVVKKGINEGKIKNIPAYTVKALEEDFRSKKPKVEIEKEVKNKEKEIQQQKYQDKKDKGRKLYDEFIQMIVNPQIKNILDEMGKAEYSNFELWINRNPLYKKYKDKEAYRFSAYRSYNKKEKELKDTDDDFIKYAKKKGMEVKKEANSFDNWIVIKDK
ncbi:MAG: hypothetical protein B6I28_06080 [Fusobacteriia bacterium 4572_132]|nr:MAG: hypothetical protein B6I28_06080 [Fusobacteriia bacterium 4572_132]